MTGSILPANNTIWRNAKIKTKTKKSKCLLIAWILGAAYVLFLFSYFSGLNTNTTDTAEALGAGLATALVMPHMIVTLLAVIFNVLGWAMNKRGFALTGGILYAVAMVLFPLYLFFVIVQMILSFVGFANLKKLNVPAQIENENNVTV